MIVQIPKEYVVFEKKIQSLCRLPYHGHSKGCPNYGKRETCPPGRPLIDEVFDLENELFAIYTSFPVGEFAERMRITHPEWSECY